MEKFALKKILCASKNLKKAEELKAIFADTAETIVSLSDFPDSPPEPPETGQTYQENALEKAKYYARFFKLPALADDSGLEVDFLNGRPGIRSARFLGKETSFSVKNKKLLELLLGVPEEKRSARFVCVAALALPDGRILTAGGELRGQIGFEMRGSSGFGFDPVFYLPKLGKTLAEISSEEKNKISHRRRALKALKEQLLDF